MQDINLQILCRKTEKDVLTMLGQAADNKFFFTSKIKNGLLLYTLFGQVFLVSCRETTKDESEQIARRD